jgi:hypothetical protein
MHEWAATSSLLPSWNAWTGAGSLFQGLMPEKNDDFSSLLPFGQPSIFDGVSNNKRIPFTLLLFLLLLGDTTFGEHQTKEAAADIMAPPASPPDLAFTQKNMS